MSEMKIQETWHARSGTQLSKVYKSLRDERRAARLATASFDEEKAKLDKLLVTAESRLNFLEPIMCNDVLEPLRH